MAVNARAMLYTVQALLPALSAGGTVCNIISNASHMPMRHSLAYNASKAAADMLTRQMARELWGTHRVTVFGVSPNRLHGTPMSVSVDRQVAISRAWSAAEVRRRQLEALPIGEETDPATVAEFVAWLLSTKERHRYLHGAILDYGI
jgi:NAD(P)-dependent dehydrogenase (short-subunit alcohol dehydrogenase family)